MRTASGIAVAILVLLGACTAPTASRPATADLPPRTAQETLTWDRQPRTYLVHLPDPLAPGSHPPLVVVLHGATLTARQTERYYHWDALADARGFAVVYPQGVNDAWNAGTCCSDAPSRGTDDVGFVGAVIADATTRFAADPSRRYLTGVSNGAMMALRFECERPAELAAIGSVAGTFTSPCDHPPPVAFIAIHGLADRVVTYGPSSSTVEAGPDIRLPAAETIGRFLAADACHDPVTASEGPVHTQTATCGPGLDVRVITIDGAGHQWPGATIDAARLALDGPHDQPSRAIDATAELWSFFSAHVLRAVTP
ncbi:MAG TPA: PHB depolymerase family esterase [Acidimicrobiales bacterium]|nr:PHB depolymerase family esterase [Acidimicrobiales bacterium]